MHHNRHTHRLVLSSLFLALALVLPFLTGQIQQFGSMLCPMHIPVLLCGFFCGWQWGLGVGLIAPVLRSALFGMPQMVPMAVCMSLELAAYGAVCGLLHRRLPAGKGSVYASLITAMIVGRLIWGAARLVFAGLNATPFTLSMFWAGAVTSAVPGIIVQLILVPLLVITLDKQR